MKRRIAILAVIAPLVLLGACGSNQKMKTAASTEETTKETKKETKKETAKKPSEKQSDVANEIKKETRAKEIKELYQNTEERLYEENGVSIKIKGYTYYQIDEFAGSLKSNFGNQNETGGVLVFDTTIKNSTDQSVFVSGRFKVGIPGTYESLNDRTEILSNDIFNEITKDKKRG